MEYSLPGSSVHGDSPGMNTGVGCHALLQGIFPTLGSNPGLPHCRWILYHLSHQGSSRILEWVAYLFSRGSAWPRSATGVSCIASRFLTSWATREAHIHTLIFNLTQFARTIYNIARLSTLLTKGTVRSRAADSAQASWCLARLSPESPGLGNPSGLGECGYLLVMATDFTFIVV